MQRFQATGTSAKKWIKPLSMKLLSLLLILFSHLSWAQRDFPFANGTLRVPELGNKATLDCVGCQRMLGTFIKAKFNQPGDFHGPNCYNTALIASGAFTSKQIRYVSPEEFEAILAQLYSPLMQATPDSLVVFDSKSSRAHAGFYLGDGLVFHKKSFGTQYHYRVAPMLEVGVPEKKEWVPSPMEGSQNQFLWPELGKLPQTFYRLNRKTLTFQSQFSGVLKRLDAFLLVDLGQWAIAKKWGLVGQNLLEDYLSLIKNQADPLTKGMLISYKDQLNLYFEELHYKNSRSYERTTAQICLPESVDQLKLVFKEVATNLRWTPEQMEAKWTQVLGQDKARCTVRLLR